MTFNETHLRIRRCDAAMQVNRVARAPRATLYFAEFDAINAKFCRPVAIDFLDSGTRLSKIAGQIRQRLDYDQQPQLLVANANFNPSPKGALSAPGFTALPKQNCLCIPWSGGWLIQHPREGEIRHTVCFERL